MECRALSCTKGGFIIVHHNEIIIIGTSLQILLTEVRKDVSIEPELQPVQPQQLYGATASTQDGVHLDPLPIECGREV